MLRTGFKCYIDNKLFSDLQLFIYFDFPEESGTTTTISFSKKPVGYLTSKTSKVTIIYEKFRRFGKGFQIVYKSKDKRKYLLDI